MQATACPRCLNVTPSEEWADGCPRCGWRGKGERVLADAGGHGWRQRVTDTLRSLGVVMSLFGVVQVVLSGLCGVGEYLHLVLTAATEASVTLIILVLMYVGGVLMIPAGVLMGAGRAWHLAVLGAFVAAFSPLLVGLPIGIWALVQLNRPAVRAVFRDNAR